MNRGTRLSATGNQYTWQVNDDVAVTWHDDMDLFAVMAADVAGDVESNMAKDTWLVTWQIRPMELHYQG